MTYSRLHRSSAHIATLALIFALLAWINPATARADTNPPDAGMPTTSSADPLPTVQLDGVVWAQTVVGDTVFVGGDFKNARPAGAAPGTNLTPRSNMLAYNIKTGELITSFAPSFNGKVQALAASADGSRLYAVGNFTSISGVARYRIAALNPSTGAVITSFNAGTDSAVKAITVSQNAVYVGGSFSSANSNTRRGLAAFRPSDGALLNWAPTADNGQVTSMVLAPDNSKVVVGGAFTTINGGPGGFGLGAVDAATGATVPWAASNLIRNAGTSAGITSLTTDGTKIYGSGYTYGPGNLEGIFAANPGDGSIAWVEDCHGDTYSAFPVGGAIYAVGHSHYCGNVGGFPQTNPWSFSRAIAFSADAKGVVKHNSEGNYYDFGGQPAPALLHWFPTLNPGTFTGQTQAAWQVSGNSEYTVLGGEFPTVNGIAQQGLVRFATAASAPNKVGPEDKGAKFMPRLSSPGSGAVRVAFPANWDRDNESLTYKVVRNGDMANPIFTKEVRSNFWTRPMISFTDTNLTPGSQASYRIFATDPRGNTAAGDTATITVASSGTLGIYAGSVFNNSPETYYRFQESTGLAVDTAGLNDGIVGAGVTRPVAGALPNDAVNNAARFNGTDSGRVVSTVQQAGPTQFTTEAWIKTTTTTGGKIIGFGDSPNATSSNYDRHLYMRNDGKINFGMYTGSVRTVTSPSALNNGQWHQIVGSLGSNGMVLYVDGVQVAADASVTTAQAFNGYWRVGGDNLNGWSNQPTNTNFTGDIDEVSIYSQTLTPTDIAAHFAARSSTQVPNNAPVAAFTSSSNKLVAAVDASTSTDTDGTIAGYAWDFGDAQTGTGKTGNHTYASAGTYQVKLTVTDNDGATGSVTKPVTVVANTAPNAKFTSTVANLRVDVDAATSTDADGTVSSYGWDYGDGQTGTGKTASHTYAANGTYSVKLTVTDNDGATDTKSADVTVAANVAPTAGFTSNVTDLSAAFDGSASADSDGTVASYEWNFGDGQMGTGKTVAHNYAAPGDYQVVLKVTDNAGSTGTITKTVTATAPVFFAKDSFTRTLATGWGTADVGGPWSVTGAATNYSVANGVGSIKAPVGGSSTAFINSVQKTDSELLATVALDKAQTGGGTYLSLFGRRVNSTNDYRAKLRYLPTGEITMTLAKTVAGTETTLTGGKIAGLTYAPGNLLNVRFDVTGTGTSALKLKVWKVGTSEPAAWSFQVTDATASLQVPGSVGASVYLSSTSTNGPITASFDNLTVGPPIP